MHNYSSFATRDNAIYWVFFAYLKKCANSLEMSKHRITLLISKLFAQFLKIWKKKNCANSLDLSKSFSKILISKLFAQKKIVRIV